MSRSRGRFKAARGDVGEGCRDGGGESWRNRNRRSEAGVAGATTMLGAGNESQDHLDSRWQF
jgi:hypothetical protein